MMGRLRGQPGDALKALGGAETRHVDEQDSGKTHFLFHPFVSDHMFMMFLFA